MLSITINDITISSYLDNYQVKIDEVYDTDSELETVNGEKNQVYLGDRRTLSVNFEPMDTQQIMQLFSAIKSSRDISIKYIDPQLDEITKIFTCPSLPAASYFEGETTKGNNKLFWTIPTINFVEKEVDTTGVAGGEEYDEYDYKLDIGGNVFTSDQIAKDISVSMSASTDGFNVGIISASSISGTCLAGGSIPVKNDKVKMYIRTRIYPSGEWSEWQIINIWFLKDFGLSENNKFFNFTAVDIMSFLDNDYYVNYQRDNDGNIIPQTVSQHISAVESMIIALTSENNISFHMLCDDIMLSPSTSTNARTLIQNVGQSSGYCYRQKLFSDDGEIEIENFVFGDSTYTVSENERESIDCGFSAPNIQTVVIYCGATTQLPCKPYENLSRDYNIYIAGSYSGYPVNANTLEVIAPYYGISAEGDETGQGGLFRSFLGTNFGTDFSCSKIKVSNLFPIGTRMIFTNDNGIEYPNCYFYASNINYSFTKTGVFASVSGTSKPASDSYYLGGMQRDLEGKITLNATYNNILIDNDGICFAAPKR